MHRAGRSSIHQTSGTRRWSHLPCLILHSVCLGANRGPSHKNRPSHPKKVIFVFFWNDTRGAPALLPGSWMIATAVIGLAQLLISPVSPGSCTSKNRTTAFHRRTQGRCHLGQPRQTCSCRRYSLWLGWPGWADDSSESWKLSTSAPTRARS